MRIALVIEQFLPSGGGAERSTSQIAQQLASRGHDVTIIAGISPPQISSENYTIESLNLPSFRSARQLRRFARWASQRLAQENFDVSLSVTMTVPAMIVQPRSGTVRETLDRNIAVRSNAFARALKRLLNLVSPKQRTLLTLERNTISSSVVRMFAAHSQYVARQLQQHYAVDSSKIVVIANASEMPKFDLSQRAQVRQRVREGFGISDEQTVYLFAALNPRLKGVVPLLHAAKVLKARGAAFVVLLAGGASYRELRLAARLGVRDQVRFIPPSDRMGELFCAADVTVHPTFYDPASKVVIESLMMNTPAISTAYNGSSDMIAADSDQPRGRVVAEADDVAGLAEAMQELADTQTRQRCVDATQGLATELSMQRHVDALEQLLLQVAQQTPIKS